ncbi:MAG TPA: hypothetical protein PK580_00235 [Nitrosomonas halophila]|nr:hypothetical protein [Nitrosomonas halophila]
MLNNVREAAGFQQSGSQNNQPCPISPSEAKELTIALQKIDARLSDIERMIFAGRVALYVVVGIMAAAGWVFDHLESMKQGVLNWLKH